MARKTMDDILNEADEAGLLTDLKPVAAPASTEEQRVREKFEEINTFVDRNGRLPGENNAKGGSLQERTLKFALAGIKADESAVRTLVEYDRHHILSIALNQPRQLLSTISSKLTTTCYILMQMQSSSLIRLHVRPHSRRGKPSGALQQTSRNSSLSLTSVQRT